MYLSTYVNQGIMRCIIHATTMQSLRSYCIRTLKNQIVKFNFA